MSDLGAVTAPGAGSPRPSEADDAAKEVAASPFRHGVGGFAAMVQPAVVDLSRGRVHTFRGRRLWGAAFAGYLRMKSVFCLPDPS